LIPAIHSFIMNDPQVQEQVLRFLQHGWFKSAAQRQPIEAGEGAQR
jgi:hypothetical protein